MDFFNYLAQQSNKIQPKTPKIIVKSTSVFALVGHFI